MRENGVWKVNGMVWLDGGIISRRFLSEEEILKEEERNRLFREKLDRMDDALKKAHLLLKQPSLHQPDIKTVFDEEWWKCGVLKYNIMDQYALINCVPDDVQKDWLMSAIEVSNVMSKETSPLKEEGRRIVSELKERFASKVDDEL